ncbi:MAG: hypothetical protein DBX44_04935 [Oscillospiraceae bacterium]|nr:MAG: hypothetical protein DBX44_04935 [Oscillospiraceae bacterium]
MEFMNSPLAGTAIILIAVVVLCIYIAGKTRRDYAAAMADYERKMAEYQAAVENNTGMLKDGVPFTPPDITMEATSDALAPYFGPTTTVGFETGVRSVGGSGKVELTGVDERTAAVVIAILCEQLGGDPSRLRFVSVKAV